MGPGTSLVGARPELLAALGALRAVLAQEHPGIVWEIADYGGLRTQADTTRILEYRENDWAAAVRADPTLPQRTTKSAWRPIAPWGSSMHNYGAAFDVKVTAAPPGMSRLAALNILKSYGDTVGLVDGRDYGDSPEYALPGGLAAAKVAWEKMTGTTQFLGHAVSVTGVTFGAVAVFALLAFLLLRRGSHV